MKVSPKARIFNNISGKISALALAISIICCTSLGILNYLNSRSALIEASKTGMEGLLNSRYNILSTQLKTIEDEIEIFSKNKLTYDAIEMFSEVFTDMEVDLPKVRSYFMNKKFTRAQRIELTGKDSRTFYAWKHTEIHPHIARLVTTNHIGDVYLVTPEGQVIYSVTKSGDFLQDLKNNKGVA